MGTTPDTTPGQAPRAAAAIPLPIGLLTAFGIAALLAGAFVTLPAPLSAFAATLAALGAVWIAVGVRRWQAALAVVILVARYGPDAVAQNAQPPGGAGTLLTLAAFAVLVLGGAWVGGRGEPR